MAKTPAVDPLNLLFILMLGFLGTKNYVIIIISVASIIFVNIIAIFIILHSDDFTILIMTTPATFLLALMCLFSKHITRIKKIVQYEFTSFETRGENFQKSIKREADICKLMAFLHIFVSMSCGFTYILSIEKKGALTHLFSNWKPHISNDISRITNLTAYSMILLYSYVPNLTGFYISYVAFHVRFQYRIITDYLRENLKKININNDKEQRECQVHLQKCVDHLIRLNRGSKNLLAITDYGMVGLNIFGMFVFVSALYGITQNPSVTDNILMILVVLEFGVIFTSSCFSGQLMINQSHLFYEFIYKTPWIYWNKTNRKTLLMILMNARTIKVTAFNVVDLDHCLLIKVFRFSYSLLTLYTNVRKSTN